LREWMDIDRECFYDQRHIAVVPMGFCYPGRGTSGDLPPRRECAELWHDQLLEHLPRVDLTLLVGRYAQRHYLGSRRKSTLTETVRAWREYQPKYLPMPHPSGRNNAWMRRNPWFEAEVLPELRRSCRRLGIV
jgi:uracil-DNA glycosylase